MSVLVSQAFQDSDHYGRYFVHSGNSTFTWLQKYWRLNLGDLALDVRHVGEGLHEVQLVALVDDLVLVGLLAVLGVDLVLEEADVILRQELSEGRESLWSNHTYTISVL